MSETQDQYTWVFMTEETSNLSTELKGRKEGRKEERSRESNSRQMNQREKRNQREKKLQLHENRTTQEHITHYPLATDPWQRQGWDLCRLLGFIRIKWNLIYLSLVITWWTTILDLYCFCTTFQSDIQFGDVCKSYGKTIALSWCRLLFFSLSEAFDHVLAKLSTFKRQFNLLLFLRRYYFIYSTLISLLNTSASKYLFITDEDGPIYILSSSFYWLLLRLIIRSLQ